MTQRSNTSHSSFQLVLHGNGDSGLGGSGSPLTAPQLLDSKRLLDVMEQYIGYYASGESHTAKAKRYDLEHFLGFLGSRAGGPTNVLVSDWTLQSTKDFIDDRLRNGEAPATVSRRLATLKHFGRTIAERLPGYINPAREAKSPTAPILRPKGLEPEQITAIREAAERRHTSGTPAGPAERFSALRNRYLL
jgi:site-specific recombinase XerD